MVKASVLEILLSSKHLIIMHLIAQGMFVKRTNLINR